MQTDDESMDLKKLDDTALLDWRVKARADLERLPPHSAEHGTLSALYEASLDALVRLLAVEVLLAEPETLGNDALETDLYILRDQLRPAVNEASAGGA